MQTVVLGNEGLAVPQIGLGCMGMSEFYARADDSDSLLLLEEAFALGCSFWDTADMYGPFTNEMLIAKALQGKRQQVTLATKFGIQRGQQGQRFGINGSAAYVKACCEASLRRLNTDYIDLYFQHRVDPSVPIEETVDAMASLVKEGKVRYLGLSEADSETIERAHRVHPISALQTEYSLWSRDVEESILPTIERLGIGYVAYSPLGRGFLTGKIRSRDDLEAHDWRLANPRFAQEAIEHNQQLVDYISGLAEKKQCSNAQLALAWLLSRSDHIALIPGTTKSERLKENVASSEVSLTPEELTLLTQYSSGFAVAGQRY